MNRSEELMRGQGTGGPENLHEHLYWERLCERSENTSGSQMKKTCVRESRNPEVRIDCIRSSV